MTVIEVAGGRLEGSTDGGCEVFRGIPFAEHPFGDRRLLAPLPARWDGVRDATTAGASAPQPAQGFTIIPEPIIPGDNCLNLNVFSPTLDRGARLPVLVWFHGGGFTNGCNASPWYDGRSFVRDGVVLVAVNYRLGLEGFLPIEGAPPNRAVLDWLAALEWVRDNVGRFGGDPDQVTIAGQSAGGVACGTLLTSPAAVGLFRRAILMSGVAGHLPDVAAGGAQVRSMTDGLGIAPTLAEVAKVSPERVIEEQMRDGVGGRSRISFNPIVDGDVVPGSPLARVRDGVGADIDVMVGTTAAEVVTVAGRLYRDADADRARRVIERLGLAPAVAAAYVEQYGRTKPWRAIGRAMTDATFRRSALAFAEGRVTGGAATNTFVYEFQWQSPTGFESVHCLDLPFVFDVLDAEKVDVVAGSEPPKELADTMHGAWVQFVKSGDPGWPTYECDHRQVMAFDAPESRVVMDPHAEMRDLFAST